MNGVLDAGAIIAFLRDEPGADSVPQALERGECLVHAANMCEVYYDAVRVSGIELAELELEDVFALGVTLRADLDREFRQAAGRLKAEHRRISLADCFGLTLPIRLAGEFLTTDRHELEALSALLPCALNFVR